MSRRNVLSVEHISTKAAPQPTKRFGFWMIGRGLALIAARARFLLLVGGVLLLIAAWPSLRHLMDRLVRPKPVAEAVSSNIEYWCPMCPGVVSDWPGKCPVCHMTLVRRKKGDMTPLPDGVVARVQLSPYRIALAGIKTSPIEFRRLEHEVIAAGRFEPVLPGDAHRLILAATVLDSDAALLLADLDAEITCGSLPGETFTGRFLEAPSQSWGRETKLHIAVDDPTGQLRPGQLAYARFRIPAARLEIERVAALNRWRDRAAVDLFAGGIGGNEPRAMASLIESAAELVLRNQGMILAVPADAVIDTGTRKVVFVESMPGMFDAIEVSVGRRCGSFYPVRTGLQINEAVVTAGNVLLDAQTRLDPSIGAGYFGSGTRGTMPPPVAPPPPGTLSPEDRILADKQKTCPVTGAPLDSMGGPVRVVVNGRPVFICCDGCRAKLLKSPEKYLSKFANK